MNILLRQTISFTDVYEWYLSIKEENLDEYTESSSIYKSLITPQAWELLTKLALSLRYNFHRNTVLLEQVAHEPNVILAKSVDGKSYPKINVTNIKITCQIRCTK